MTRALAFVLGCFVGAAAVVALLIYEDIHDFGDLG